MDRAISRSRAVEFESEIIAGYSFSPPLPSGPNSPSPQLGEPPSRRMPVFRSPPVIKIGGITATYSGLATQVGTLIATLH
jgi:hypothetical protein